MKISSISLAVGLILLALALTIIPFSFLILLFITFFLINFIYFLPQTSNYSMFGITFSASQARMIALSVIAFSSLACLKNYFNPQNNGKTYNNIDHCAIAHHGFEFKQSFNFSSTNSDYGFFPHIGNNTVIQKDSLPDSISRHRIISPNPVLPLYISEKNTVGTGSIYNLSNFSDSLDLTNGFEIKYKLSNKEYSYQIKRIKNASWANFFRKIPILGNFLGERHYGKYIISYNDGIAQITDTTAILNINYGLPLTELFYSASKIPIDRACDSIFQNTSLIKQKVYRDTDMKNESPLILFPSITWRNNKEKILLLTNDQSTVDFEFLDSLEVTHNQTFFFGFNQRAGNNGLVFKLKGDDRQKYYSDSDTILFEFPHHYGLKNDAQLSESFFINSDSKDILQRNYDAGYYLNFNQSERFKHHVRASISYQPSRASTPQHFVITDHNNLSNPQLKLPIRENERFSLEGKNGPSLKWIFEVKNFRQTFRYSTGRIYTNLMIVYFIFLMSLMLFQNKHKGNMEMNNIAFILLAFLSLVVAIRFFLVWRIAVFPPLDGINIREFSKLHGGFSAITVTNLGIFVFIILLFAKILSGKKISKAIENNFGQGITSRFIGRGALNSIVSNKVFDFHLYKLKRSNLLYFGLVTWLISVTPGTGIASHLFALLYFLMSNLHMSRKIHSVLSMNSENVTFTDKSAYIERILRKKLHLFLATCVIFFFLDKGFLILSFFLGLVYFLIEKYTLGKEYPQIAPGRFSKLSLLTACMLTVILLLAKPTTNALTNSTIFSSLIEKVPHFYFRAKVFSNGLKQVVSETDFTKSDKVHLLRAAHNKWFISNYFWPAKSANPLDNYFQLQPHSKRGVSYLTQTSDLVSIRYIISEHSEMFLVAFIAFIIALFWMMIRYLDFKNSYHLCFMAVFYFIAIRSIFVWMTVTNRIVFFGQDFPFFSINSKVIVLSSFFFLGLLLLLFRTSNRANREFIKPLNWLPASLLILLVVLYVSDRGFELFNNRSSSAESFNLTENLTEVKNNLRYINRELSSIQSDSLGNIDFLLDPNTALTDFFNTELKKSDSVVKTNLDKSSAFNKSVLKNFFLNSANDKTSLNNLIFAYRSNNGEYRLKMRSDFFTIPAISDRGLIWKGSVLSAPIFSGYKLIAQDSIENKSIKWDKVQLLSLSRQGVQDSKLKGVLYPESWGKLNNPVVLFWTEGAVSGFTLSNNVFKYNSDDDDELSDRTFTYPIKLSVLDYITTSEKIQEDGSIHNKIVKSRIEIVSDKNQYLAKNVWLNGKKNKFLYPMGHKYIWSHHVAELGKARISQLLKDSIHLEYINIPTTIDYKLTNNVYQIVERQQSFLARGGQDRFGKIKPMDFSLVAIDGNSNIRLLFDYKPEVHGAREKLDPNKEGSFYEILAKYEKVNNTLEERQLFGHSALLKMSPGPGSSFKPYTYASVISGYNFNWEGLTSNVNFDRGAITKISDGKERAVKYAGRSIQAWTNLLDANIRTPQSYISQSSNYYNSIMVFAGSYNRNLWDETYDYVRSNHKRQPEDSFLIKSTSPVGRSYKKNEKFPIINIGGTKFFFNKDNWPGHKRTDVFGESSSKLFGDLNGTLPKYLNANFGYAIRRPNITGTKRMNTDLFRTSQYLENSLEFKSYLGMYSESSNNAHQLWTFPENVSFVQDDRTSTNTYYEAGGKGLRQPTVGGEPLITTPLKMAEDAIRLFYLDKNKKSTVLDDTIKHNRSSFDFDNTYENENDFFTTLQSTLFTGMYRTTIDGTAKSLIGSKAPNENDYSRGKKDYHVYVKTGTLGQADSKGDLKALLVVFSRIPIHDKSQVGFEDIVNNKVYALYYTFYSSAGDNYKQEMKSIVTETLEAVTNSVTFSNYWND